jgi:hypothetical protein
MAVLLDWLAQVEIGHLDEGRSLDRGGADLIISDVNLFGTNGIDFLEPLIRTGCKPRRLALISGTFFEADLSRAPRLGNGIR